jgi:hypothetical protein
VLATDSSRYPDPAMAIRYKLGCNLSYEIKALTTFIFNFEVAHLMRHIDLVESLINTSDLPRRTYIVLDVRHRLRQH